MGGFTNAKSKIMPIWGGGGGTITITAYYWK